MWHRKEKEMENIDRVIEVLCGDICKNHEQMMIKDLSDLTKALADLVVAKAHVVSVEHVKSQMSKSSRYSSSESA